MGEHSATLEPATQMTSAPTMSDQGLVVRSMPNAFLLAAPRADHAEAAVVVDVRGLEADAGELAQEVGLLRGEAGAAQHAHRGVAVLVLDALDLRGDPGDRVGVGHRAEPGGVLRVAADRGEESDGVVPLVVALDDLGAEHAAVEGEFFPRLEADDDVVLDLELDAALLAAEAAVGLDQRVGLDVGGQAVAGHAGAVRPELPGDPDVLNRHGRHPAPSFPIPLPRAVPVPARTAPAGIWGRSPGNAPTDPPRPPHPQARTGTPVAAAPQPGLAPSSPTRTRCRSGRTSPARFAPPRPCRSSPRAAPAVGRCGRTSRTAATAG